MDLISTNSKIVQKYVDKTTSEINQGTARLETIGGEGLSKFEENVITWLGSLKAEIEEYQTAFFEIVPGRGVTFTQVFTWNSCEGLIITSGWGYPWSSTFKGPATWLKMHVPNSLAKPQIMKLSVDRPACCEGDYVDIARPIDETALGAFLLDVIRDLDHTREAREIRAKQERFVMLKIIEDGFLQLEDIPSVQQYLAQICQSNPDELSRWNAASKRRTLEITKQHEARKIVEQQAALEDSERNRLAAEAADLFRPFTAFRLKIGVKLPDEDRVYFTTVYTTAAVPDERGWYTQIDRGQLADYRPECLVDVTRINIDSVDHVDAPLICRHVELISDRLPYLTERALATPEGLG